MPNNSTAAFKDHPAYVAYTKLECLPESFPCPVKDDQGVHLLPGEVICRSEDDDGDFCGKKFSSPSGLTKHWDRTHKASLTGDLRVVHLGSYQPMAVKKITRAWTTFMWIYENLDGAEDEVIEAESENLTCPPRVDGRDTSQKKRVKEEFAKEEKQDEDAGVGSSVAAENDKSKEANGTKPRPTTARKSVRRNPVSRAAGLLAQKDFTRMVENFVKFGDRHGGHRRPGSKKVAELRLREHKRTNNLLAGLLDCARLATGQPPIAEEDAETDSEASMDDDDSESSEDNDDDRGGDEGEPAG